MFQLLEVGLSAPPVSPVIVLPAPVLKRETAPPVTVKSAELKEATPTVEVVALLPVTVRVAPEPEVVRPLEPLAVKLFPEGVTVPD
jgi:hypothetical protein